MKDELRGLLQGALRAPGTSDATTAADSFRRTHETCLLALALHPELVYFFRHRGRNRLLAELNSLREEGEELALDLLRACSPSRGKAQHEHLYRAQKHLNAAVTVRDPVGSNGKDLAKFRQEVERFSVGLRADASGTGEEARRSAGNRLSPFVDRFEAFMGNFVTFVGGPTTYSAARARSVLSDSMLRRAARSVSAAERLALRGGEELQARRGDLLQTLAASTSTTRTLDAFRDLGDPLASSLRVNQVGGEGTPKGSSYALSAAGEVTPATVVASKAPGELPVGACLRLSANGGSEQSAPIPGAGKFHLFAPSPSFAIEGGKLYVSSLSANYEITLTDNPNLPTLVSDLNVGLPAHIDALESQDGLLLESDQEFHLGSGPSSAAGALGLPEGVPAHKVTTSMEAASAAQGLSGVTATSKKITIGEESGDASFEVGKLSLSPSSPTVTSDTNLEEAGVQSGDTIVVKEGPAAGSYTVKNVVADEAEVYETAPAAASGSGFYAVSDRLQLDSVSADSGSSVSVGDYAEMEEMGLPRGEISKGTSSAMEITGTSKVQGTQGVLDLRLRGVEEGDVVTARKDGTTLTFQVEEHPGSSEVRIRPMEGSQSMPADLEGAEFEIHPRMKQDSMQLSQGCRGWVAGLRKRTEFSKRGYGRVFRAQVGDAVNNPSQLRRRVQRPWENLVGLLKALGGTLPNQTELERRADLLGFSMPASSGPSLSSILEAYEDASSARLKRRGKALLRGLQDTGYDRAKNLLLFGGFKEFVDLSEEDASYGAQILDRSTKVASKGQKK